MSVYSEKLAGLPHRSDTYPTAGQTWQWNAAGYFEPGTVLPIAAELGDGSDGDVVINALVILARDMYYNTLTVNVTTGFLATAGFSVFVKGACVCNGFIFDNGADAAAGVGGTGAALGSIGGGTAGGNGGVAGAGANGTNIANAIGVRGGAGGNGPAGVPLGGAAGLIISAPPATAGGIQVIKRLEQALTMRDLTATVLSGSTGGGGGGGNGGTGGGGGGGAGCLLLAANSLTGAGAIVANGGNGANAVSGNSGGGGGGGGGFVMIITTIATTITTQAGGGVHGNLLGTGANGADGNAGTIVKMVL